MIPPKAPEIEAAEKKAAILHGCKEPLLRNHTASYLVCNCSLGYQKDK
jgi:hypothetical protein